MRAGIIDIGSRSIKLLVGESGKTSITVIESLKNVAPLAHDTFSKDRISQETINLAVSILERYTQTLKEYDISEVKVIATTAVREARNRTIFVDTILRKTGLAVEVLTPGDIIYYIDAYLSYKLKDAYPIHEKNLLIAELGSGSLDVSIMEQGFTQMHIGIPLGTLRLKQLMGSLSGSRDENIEAVGEYIANEFVYLSRSLFERALDDVILIDENYSDYITHVLPEKKREENLFSISRSDASELLTRLRERTPQETARVFKLPADLADTAAAYAAIINAFFTITRGERIYILQTSLAEAVLAHTLLELELSKKYNKTNQLIAVSRALCQKYHIDLSHAQNVAELSEMLFAACREQLGLKKDTLLYLTLAAYLHDIGMFISNRAHHKHSEYIITALNLFRLSEEELKLIACIARYHRKAPPSETHLLYGSLAPDKQLIVQKLSALLRIANALDRSHKQKTTKIEVKRNQNQDITLIVYTNSVFDLEQQDFIEKKGLFEEITGNRITLSLRSDTR